MALELALCQRYYEKSYDLATVPGTATAIGQSAFFIHGLPSSTGKEVTFRVTKRVPPAMTGYSPQTGAAGKTFSAALAADIPIAFQDIGVSAVFCTIGRARRRPSISTIGTTGLQTRSSNHVSTH